MSGFDAHLVPRRRSKEEPEWVTKSGEQHSQEEEEEEELVDNSVLWPPTIVVKSDRKVATFVWVLLLLGLAAYIVYMIVDMSRRRVSPSVSITFQREYYGLPDILLCSGRRRGCMTEGQDCWDNSYTALTGVVGFVEDELPSLTVDEEQHWRSIHPDCMYIPLSRFTVDEAWLARDDTEDIALVSLDVGWLEDPKNTTLYPGIARVLSVAFVNDGDESTFQYAGEVPYRVIGNVTAGDGVVYTETTMALSSEQYLFLNKNGPPDGVRKYHQTSASYEQVTTWNDEDLDIEIAILLLEVAIKDFEFVRFEEVDPVNFGDLVGDVGGAWGIIVTIFGVLFILDRKVVPSKVRRRWRAILVPRRISSLRHEGVPVLDAASSCHTTAELGARSSAPSSRTKAEMSIESCGSSSSNDEAHVENTEDVSLGPYRARSGRPS